MATVFRDRCPDRHARQRAPRADLAIDFDKRVVHVRQHTDLWGTIGDPKSAAGARVIPMAPMVVKRAAGVAPGLPEGQARPRVSQWQRQCREPRQHRWPRLRTIAEGVFWRGQIRAPRATPLLRVLGDRAGFTPKRLQALLGHSSIQMTFDTYGHLFPSLEDDHAKFAAGELKIRGGRCGVKCGRDRNAYRWTKAQADCLAK